MYPPFFNVTTILKDILNLETWDTPPRYVIEDILNVAYNDIKSNTTIGMTKFYNGITIALRLYKDRKINKNESTNTTTVKNLTHTKVRKSALDNVTNGDKTCDELENVNHSKRSLESENYSDPNKRSKVIDNSTVQLRANPDIQSKPPSISCETTDPTNSLMTVNVDYDNISVEGEIDMSTLLDSGCNYHLTNTHIGLTDFIANDDIDSLNDIYYRIW